MTASCPTTTSSLIQGGGFLGNTALKMMGVKGQRFSYMQQSAIKSFENFREHFDAAYREMRSINEEFKCKTPNSEMTNKEIADYWRRYSMRFRLLASQFNALELEARQIAVIFNQVAVKAEIRMNQWALTKWLEDHGLLRS